MKRRKVAFLTVGCRANQADTSRMVSALVPDSDPVDLGSSQCDAVIVNTCAVTSRAEADCRKLIRRARRRHPDARIIVTGCAAQVKPQAWASMPEVDAVLGLNEPERIQEYLNTTSLEMSVSGEPSGGVTGPTPLHGHRSRPFLKIQDGCSRGCTYCIVPLARGPERSRPAEMVRDDIIRLADAGYREIVLTGVHLGRWGYDLRQPGMEGGSTLVVLLASLEGIQADVRLRWSSIEPMDLTPDQVATILSHPLVCPHLHLPVQSGDQGILNAMGRGHSIDHFVELLLAAKAARPDAGLGTDIMIGFPGEDEAAFRNTLDLVAKQPFTYLHIFTFSPRPLTPAASLPDRPPGSEVQKRLKALHEVDRAKRRAFREAMHGQRRTCLIETPSLPARDFSALSDNYLRLRVRPAGHAVPAGQLVPLLIDTNDEREYGMPEGVLDFH